MGERRATGRFTRGFTTWSRGGFTFNPERGPFLHGEAFDPETVEAMGKAFVTTCEALGLSDRDDAMAKLVAEKIIELAQRGLKNPTAAFGGNQGI